MAEIYTERRLQGRACAETNWFRQALSPAATSRIPTSGSGSVRLVRVQRHPLKARCRSGFEPTNLNRQISMASPFVKCD